MTVAKSSQGFASRPVTNSSDDQAAACAVAASRPVAIWLVVLTFLVAGMVLVGGATRLTDSGLSIVEWAPVTGVLPPLSEADWRVEFEKYQAIPEFRLVNWRMSLEEFKGIYWWEWGHRLYGRVIGLAVLLPLVYFAVRRKLTRRLGVRLAAVFVLVVAQGALGWWMVSSGLSERVDVSQYRLAAHLGLAVLLFGWLLWLSLEASGVGHGQTNMKTKSMASTPQSLQPFAFLVAVALYIQIILGAFVAGLRAGHVFPTWPMMDGRFVPDGYFEGAGGVAHIFETAAAVQFNHRLWAYLVCAIVVAFWMRARGTPLARHAALLLAATFGQALIGVVTVVNATPIGLGLLHQAGALVVFAAAVATLYGATASISIRNAPSSAG